MRETLLTAFAAAIVLSAATLHNRADATTASMEAVAASSRTGVQLAVSVCGSNGCSKVQTHRIQHHRPGNVPMKHT